MKTARIWGTLAVVLVACGGDVQNGSGGSGSSSSSSSSGAGGAGGAGGSGGAGAGGMAGAGGGCGLCDFTCCGATCVNTNNDIMNCGACGTKCPGTTPFCDNGTCGTPPCNGALCGPAGLCCGANCCQPGELCCDVPGPVGNMLGCFAPNAAGTCPTGCASCVCAAPDTPVATPTGERPMASLAAGDLVYSVHRGAVVAVPLRKTQRVPAKDHVVMRVELAGGRVLEMSPAHPTADGRVFLNLKAGEALDGVPIVDVRPVSYRWDATYDILPDSDSATYFAAGALIGSTMARPAVPVLSTSPASH